MFRALALMLVLFSAQPSFSAEKERFEAARELVEISQAGQIMNQMLDAMLPNMMNIALGQNPSLTEEQKEKIRTLTSEGFKERFPEFLDLTALLYAELFSEEELRDILAFQQSPTGQKVISLMPRITTESMTYGQIMGQQVAEEVFATLKQDGDI